MYICVLSLFCVHPVSAESTSDPIIVGVIHSKTHPSAESMKKSFEMAVEAKNEEGGVRGRSLQIVYADDGLAWIPISGRRTNRKATAM
jgi:hypothetical protein